jgi:TRAP-type C4-dicarboxylate transport system permease small subunit
LFFYHVNLLAIWLPMLVCDVWFLMQGPSLSAGAWPVSYETVGSSSGAVERRTPSSGELSLIRSLRDQLQNSQRQLKVVTAKVDVALSKASHAANCEKFLLDEIENLGKSLQCESFRPL